jgi:hypothetical protein
MMTLVLEMYRIIYNTFKQFMLRCKWAIVTFFYVFDFLTWNEISVANLDPESGSFLTL